MSALRTLPLTYDAVAAVSATNAMLAVPAFEIEPVSVAWVKSNVMFASPKPFCT